MKNPVQFILPAIIAATALTSCTMKIAQDEPSKKIEVTGSAEMEVVPDEIYMTFTLREYLDQAKQKVKLDGIKATFLAQCKTAGILDSNISISGYSGYERWDYWYYRRRKAEPDFMNTVSYTIKVNIPANLDKLIGMVDDKAMQHFSISKTSHSKMEELRKDVKKKALVAARNKADYLADGIGEEIGEAILVQEIENSDGSDIYGGRSYSSNTIMEYKAVNEDAAYSPSSPGFEKIKLRYEIKAEFRLK